jgi:hypothetical protein
MVSRSSIASSDSRSSRPAMDLAGPPQSLGGQAPRPPPPAQGDRPYLPPASHPRYGRRGARDVQVVLLEEPRALAKPQRRQRHIGRGGRQFQRTVARGAQAELVEVDALPAHRDLDNGSSRSVKDAGTGRRRHIIGLIPISHTLICRVASAPSADCSAFPPCKDCFGRSVIRQITAGLLVRPHAPLESLCSLQFAVCARGGLLGIAGSSRQRPPRDVIYFTPLPRDVGQISDHRARPLAVEGNSDALFARGS